MIHAVLDRLSGVAPEMNLGEHALKLPTVALEPSVDVQ